MIGSQLPLENTSIAVAGAGIVGMSVAWRLAQRGARVTVFDRGAVGGEASWAGAGMLAPGGEIERESVLAPLAIRSRNLYPAFVSELQRESGLFIDYQECGALDLAYSSGEAAELDRRAEAQLELGISSKPLTATQVSTFWPRVRGPVHKARFYPGDAVVNPRDVIAAVKVACGKLNVRIHENCRVSAADISTQIVKTFPSQGSPEFDALVIAAGAWSSSIELNGVPAIPRAAPVKGHLIGYQQPEQTCNTIVRRGHTYLLQRSTGLMIAGASVEYVGFDRAIDTSIAADLAAQAAFVFPHLNETTPSEVWIGFRPHSDELHAGRWHSRRLYLAYGHFRNGILLAPVTAEKIADELTSNLGTH